MTRRRGYLCAACIDGTSEGRRHRPSGLPGLRRPVSRSSPPGGITGVNSTSVDQFALMRRIASKCSVSTQLTEAYRDAILVRNPVIGTFSRDGFLEEAGLWPVMMMKQLRQGGEQAIPFVARAHELWRGEGPVPERVWAKAARELGIE